MWIILRIMEKLKEIALDLEGYKARWDEKSRVYFYTSRTAVYTI